MIRPIIYCTTFFHFYPIGFTLPAPLYDELSSPDESFLFLHLSSIMNGVRKFVSNLTKLFFLLQSLVIDRTLALSETYRTELFGHSLPETTELNRTELLQFWLDFFNFSGPLWFPIWKKVIKILLVVLRDIQIVEKFKKKNWKSRLFF